MNVESRQLCVPSFTGLPVSPMAHDTANEQQDENEANNCSYYSNNHYDRVVYDWGRGGRGDIFSCSTGTF